MLHEFLEQRSDVHSVRFRPLRNGLFPLRADHIKQGEPRLGVDRLIVDGLGRHKLRQIDEFPPLGTVGRLWPIDTRSLVKVFA